MQVTNALKNIKDLYNIDIDTKKKEAEINILNDKISNDKDKPIQITFTKASEKNG